MDREEREGTGRWRGRGRGRRVEKRTTPLEAEGELWKIKLTVFLSVSSRRNTRVSDRAVEDRERTFVGRGVSLVGGGRRGEGGGRGGSGGGDGLRA